MASRSNRFTEIAEQARKKTNQKLSEELAALTPIRSDQLARMLPTKGDKEEFARLMAIVHSATSHNEKVAAIRENIGTFAGVTVKLLKTIV